MASDFIPCKIWAPVPSWKWVWSRWSTKGATVLPWVKFVCWIHPDFCILWLSKFQNLDADSRYEVIIQSKNKFGWSEPTKSFIFSTRLRGEAVVYLCIIFVACSAFLLYLDDVTYAVWKNRGLGILDWYFREGMETHKAGKNVYKRKECRNCLQKICVHTVNEQTNKRSGPVHAPIPFYEWLYFVTWLSDLKSGPIFRWLSNMTKTTIISSEYRTIIPSYSFIPSEYRTCLVFWSLLYYTYRQSRTSQCRCRLQPTRRADSTETKKKLVYFTRNF